MEFAKRVIANSWNCAIFVQVEEEVLESLVWTSDSPLWEQLSKTEVPASAGVYVHESPLRRINSKFSTLS